MSSRDHQLADAHLRHWEYCFVISEVSQWNDMRIDPLSDVIFDVSVGVEGEAFLEQKEGNVVD